MDKKLQTMTFLWDVFLWPCLIFNYNLANLSEDMDECECIYSSIMLLNHWGWVTHICISKLTIIGSDNGLSPGRRQAIIWTNAEILLIGPLVTNFSEILLKL